MLRARLGLLAALVVSLVLMITANARADKRVALVIGVSSYQYVPRLPNTTNDAAAVTAVLRNANFDVVEILRDVGISELRRAVREFADIARDADIATVYYAGHGIEVDGVNYLIPADAKLASDFDVEDETLSLDRLLKAVESAKRLRLVILDACRENPFAKSMKRTIGTRSINRGLAKVEPTVSNTLVAFAAKAGAVAEDGDGKNSPFTTSLIKNVATPGLDLRIAFGRIRDEVLRSTNNRQEPFVYGSLGGDMISLLPPLPEDPNAEARRDYEYAAQIGTKDAWASFLKKHTAGLYADLARAQLGKLLSAEQTSLKADEARRQAEEQARLKAGDFRRQLEEQAARQAAEAKRQMSEQAKRELDEARRQIAEQAERELKEARRQVEEAQRAAEEARGQIDEVRQQAVDDAQKQVEEAKRQAAADTARAAASDDGKITVAKAPATQPGEPAAAIATAMPAMDPTDIARLVQAHLKRVGCDPGTIDGNWNDASKKTLRQFNRIAGTAFDVEIASLEVLDAVRAKTNRVCPLVCEKGQRVDGNRCTAITCDPGFALSSDGTCRKRPDQKSATRPGSKAQTARASVPAVTAGRGKCFTFDGKRFCE